MTLNGFIMVYLNGIIMAQHKKLWTWSIVIDGSLTHEYRVNGVWTKVKKISSALVLFWNTCAGEVEV